MWRQLALAHNWPLLAAVAALCGVGLLTIGSVEPAVARNQAVYLGIGVAAMAVFQAVNYAKLGRLALPFYVVSLLLVGVTVIGTIVSIPFVPRINGASNWIRLGPASIQPAELMKVSFIMLLARYLRFGDGHRTLRGLVWPAVLAGVPMVLILKQPDLGTCLVFVPTTLAMLFVAGAKVRHFVGIALLGTVLLPVAWLSGQPHVPVLKHGPDLVKTYQRERVYAMFKDDEGTLQRTGYQQFYGLAALGSGGLTGKGPGNVPVGRRVPESQNDMVFVVVGEQFGFVGSLVVIANLAVATKLMPVTGVTLPFVSSGGSSLIASFMAIGILLNVGQHRPFLLARDAFDYR